MGARLLITRSKKRSQALLQAVEARAGEALIVPLIGVEMVDWSLSQGSRPLDFDWWIFTSQNGVCGFAQAIDAEALARNAGGRLRVAAVGAATRSTLERFGLSVALCPEAEQHAEALLGDWRKRGPAPGASVLIVQGQRAPLFLLEELTAAGFECERVDVYKTALLSCAESLQAAWRGCDAVFICSGSAAQGLKQNLGELCIEGPEAPKMVSIGPKTSKNLKDLGVSRLWQARQPSVDGLIEAAVRALTA